MSVENPGSLIDWAGKQGIDANRAHLGYDKALDDYRARLAEEKGITPEQLHDGFSTPSIIEAGRMAVATEVQLDFYDIFEELL